MTKKRKAKLVFFIYGLVIIILTALVMFCLIRGKIGRIKIQNETFTESSRELRNPNRGFYKLYSFLITDRKQNYKRTFSAMYQEDEDAKLILIQICLRSYNQGSITEEGLANIEALFDVLEKLDKQLIIRFTYDIEGENEIYEPENLDIILTHMDQLSRILNKYSKSIFSLQGLFIGNWGEMNGTKFDSDADLRKLAEKLADVTDPSTYLAVRSPAKWRSIMQSKSWQQDNLLKGRLGLFNDGMLGNKSDYGTYQIGDETDTGSFPRFDRQEELAFQNELCREVPNGGEVIRDNVYNDLDNAVKDLERMHVTYLNKAYDQEVLKKWADTVITEEGCFKGMDGLTYIERHLGYRLSIVDTGIYYQNKEKSLTVDVTLKNEGFAPLYMETQAQIILYHKKREKTLVYPLTGDLHTLAGGEEKEDTLKLSAEIPLDELSEKEYTVYFSILDVNTGEKILLANEEDAQWHGYQIGKVRW